jgi:hypothetical protein
MLVLTSPHLQGETGDHTQSLYRTVSGILEVGFAQQKGRFLRYVAKSRPLI